jgi:putative transposase
MKINQDIRHGRHCVFNLHIHLVFVTKYRRGVFTKVVIDDLQNIFAQVCIDFEAELVEFDGEDDHVHLLVNYPPKVSISSLVNSLKGVSSRMIRKKDYPEIRKKLWGGALWSPSYFAGSCGGAPISIIRQYIEQQRTPE